MPNKPISSDRYSNILTVIDEFSRFPFAFPTRNRTSATVIQCLTSLFSLCGPSESVHSDRGAKFFSAEMSSFLSTWGVHHSRTTSYHPQGNGQTERCNGIIWKTLQGLLVNHTLSQTWPTVLGEALRCLRSLVTTTGSTPYERFLCFIRRFQPLPSAPIQAGNYTWM